MAMTLHELASGTFAPMLRSLAAILDKGADYARTQGIAEQELLDARLAPDMYPLTRQVQLACSNACEGIEHLTGREPPVFDGVAATFRDLTDCIARAIAYLDATPRDAFARADSRRIEFPLPAVGPDMAIVMTGAQLLRDWALPHFYFHVVTAYDILRQRGLDIGKRDYLARVGEYIGPTR